MEVEGPVESSSLGRKRLSDITNMTSIRSGPDKGCHEKPITAKDYIGHLLKENNALLRLIEERNKIVEISGMELQKLKFSLQKANEQNWQLAQANSQMLAQLNLGKDRLKALQHELGCTVAVLKTKTSELDEEKKLNRQGKLLQERINHETLREGHTKPAVVVSEDPSLPANCKKPCNTNRKRTLRSRSLGPAIVLAHQETTKEKEECRRRLLRRRSSNPRAELQEPSEDLFEIEDVKLPVRSYFVRQRASVPPSPIAVINSVKDEPERDRSVSPRSQGRQELRRASLGRPSRRAAEKVSYKEVPINVKMRRSD
ncbi:SHUGOSHIN 2-like isoform X1 [Iris pallida]|uniref:SHUGOSHIN 2-like isoform X1 n=1 Tax=Iris pallida TaxID=29817 RepID=A0AAX6FZN1_IRIPA|nr:SHUGOSHIN 2-like isoform X1 [Iris pallida]